MRVDRIIREIHVIRGLNKLKVDSLELKVCFKLKLIVKSAFSARKKSGLQIMIIRSVGLQIDTTEIANPTQQREVNYHE